MMKRPLATMLMVCSAACVDEDGSAPDDLGEARQTAECSYIAFPSSDYYNAGGIGGSAQFEHASQDPDPSYMGEPMYGYGHGDCDFYAVQWSGADYVLAEGPDFAADQCEVTDLYMKVWYQATLGSSWTLAGSRTAHGYHDGTECLYIADGSIASVNLPGTSVYRVRVAARVEGYDSSDPNSDQETRRVRITAVRN